MTTTKLYRLSEVAALLQVHAKTVYYWVRTGRVVAIASPGGMLRIRSDDVQKLCADAGMPPPVEAGASYRHELAADCRKAAQRCKAGFIRECLDRAANELGGAS